MRTFQTGIKAAAWGASLFYASAVLMSATAQAAEDWSGNYAGLALGLSQNVADANTKTQGTGIYYNAQDQAQVRSHTDRDFKKNLLNANAFWGFNKQSGNWVYGLEGTLSLMNFNETYDVANVTYTSTPGQNFDIHTKVTSHWNAKLRPRVGYSQDKSLYFVAAGPAVTQVKYDFTFRDRPANNEYSTYSSNDLKLGWSVGAGYEYKLRDGWSLKAEFSYTDFGNVAKGTSNLKNWDDGFNHEVDYSIANAQVGIVKRF